MSFLLDTNICIALLKGHERGLHKKLQQYAPADFYLCSLVKAELLYGARHSQKTAENVQLLTQFFAPFASLPFDDKAADYYGTIRALLAQAGTPIGGNDLLIASIALAHDLTIVTRNYREFSRVTGLRVEMW